MEGSKIQGKVRSHIRRHFSQPIMKSRNSTHSPSNSDASTTSTTSTLAKPSVDNTTTVAATTYPEPKQAPDITGRTITIKVGGPPLLTSHSSYTLSLATQPTHTPTETFHIHASALSTSLFFRKALRLEWIGPWATSNPDPILLPDEDPVVFGTYVRWAYFRVLPSQEDIKEWKELADLYVLGEKLVDAGFQTAVLHAIIDRCLARSAVPSYPFIKTVYAGTTTNKASPVRKLVTDFWVWGAKAEWDDFGDLAAKTHTEFVEDLVRGLLGVRVRPGDQRGRPWVAEREVYLRGIGCLSLEGEGEEVGTAA